MWSDVKELREALVISLENVLEKHMGWLGLPEDIEKDVRSLDLGEEMFVVVAGEYSAWTRSWKTAKRVLESASADALFLRLYLTVHGNVQVLSRDGAEYLVDNWGRFAAMKRSLEVGDTVKMQSVVNALASIDPELPKAQMVMKVLATLQLYKVTGSEFVRLDEKPGIWGYRVLVDGLEKEWHWRLRYTRNHAGHLLQGVLVKQ